MIVAGDGVEGDVPGKVVIGKHYGSGGINPVQAACGEHGQVGGGKASVGTLILNIVLGLVILGEGVGGPCEVH